MTERDSRFRKAVMACSDLTLREGLQAVSTADREKIHTENTRSVTGSVNIDKDLENHFPTDSRWDYAVGYRGSDNGERTYFIEVHPAETSEVRCVINKVRSLRAWAERSAPDLWNMTVPREIHWIASGRCNIRLNDSYRRQLAMEGVGSPKRYLELT